MDKQQKEYAVKRIDDIVARRLALATKEHTTPIRNVTVAELIDGIKGGKIKAKLGEEVCPGPYHDIYEVFDLTSIGYGRGGRDAEAIEKDMAPIFAEARRIKDELMLGEAEKALALINKFEK